MYSISSMTGSKKKDFSLYRNTWQGSNQADFLLAWPAHVRPAPFVACLCLLYIFFGLACLPVIFSGLPGLPV